MIKRKESPSSEIKAFLGKGSDFEGHLTFSEMVRIDGDFKGSIKSRDTLIIGDGAVVKAEIDVGKAVISGSVEGNITARERLELHPPAKVQGSVKTPRLVIIDGAVFEGICNMMSIEHEEIMEEVRRPSLLTRLEAVN